MARSLQWLLPFKQPYHRDQGGFWETTMGLEQLAILALFIGTWAVTGHFIFLGLRAVVRAFSAGPGQQRHDTAVAALSCVRRLAREGRLDAATFASLEEAIKEERLETATGTRSARVRLPAAAAVPDAIDGAIVDGAVDAEPGPIEADALQPPPLPVTPNEEQRPLIERYFDTRPSEVTSPAEVLAQELAHQEEAAHEEEPAQEHEPITIAGSPRARRPMPAAEDKGLGFIPVLERFMDRRNIGWIDLLGGILILGGSIGLLTYFWSEIKEKPYLEIAVFGLVNAAISGFGILTAARFRMPTTSRSLLMIGALLMPLTHASWASLGATHRDIGLRFLIVFGSVVLNILLYRGSMTLFKEERRRLFAGMIVPCAVLTATTFMEDLISRPVAATMIVLAALAFIAEVHSALERHRSEDEDAKGRTARLILPICLAAAAFVPVFAVVFRRHAGYTLADDLSPVFAAIAVTATAVSFRLGSIKTTGAETDIPAFLLGVGSVAATFFCLLLAWPAPHLSLTAAIVTIAGWVAISRAEGRSALATAAGILSLHAWLCVWHVVLGHVELTTGRVLVTDETFYWLGRSAGVALAIAALAMALMHASRRRDESALPRDGWMTWCAAITACFCILRDGYFVEGDLTSVVVLTLLASTSVLFDRVLPDRGLAPNASILGAGAAYQFFVHTLPIPIERALLREIVLIAIAFAFATWNLAARRRDEAGGGDSRRFAQNWMAILSAMIAGVAAMERYSHSMSHIAASEAAAGVVLALLIAIADRQRIAVTVAHGLAVVSAMLAATAVNHTRGLSIEAGTKYDPEALGTHALALTAVLFVAIFGAFAAGRRRKTGDPLARDFATLLHEGADLHLTLLMTLPLAIVGTATVQGLFFEIAWPSAGPAAWESILSLLSVVGAIGFVLIVARRHWTLPIIILAGVSSLGALIDHMSVLVLILPAAAAAFVDRVLPWRRLAPIVSILGSGAIYQLLVHTLPTPLERALLREVVLIAIAFAFACWNFIARRRAEAGRGGLPRYAQGAMATAVAMVAAFAATARYTYSTAHVAACEAAACVVLFLLLAATDRRRIAVTVAFGLAVLASILGATAFNHAHDLSIDASKGFDLAALGTHILALTAVLLVAVAGAAVFPLRRKAGDASSMDLAALLHREADLHLPTLTALPLALIGAAAFQGLNFDVAGLPAGFMGWKPSLSLVLVIGALSFIFFVMRRGWTLPFLFFAGLCASCAVIDAFDFEARWITFSFAVLLPLYAFATTAIAVVGRLAVDRSVPSTWFQSTTLALAILGAGASFEVIATHGSSGLGGSLTAALVRMLAALAVLPYAAAQLLLGTHGKDRRHFVFMFAIVAVSAFALLQAMVDPHDVPTAGNRMAAFFVAASAVVALTRGLDATIGNGQPLWGSARALRVPADLLLAGAMLLLGVYEASDIVGRTFTSGAIDGVWCLTIAVAFIGMIGGCLALALKSTAVDRKARPSASRLADVWMAEVFVGALLLHVRYAKPEWFSGFFMNYWPFVVIGVAFLFLGVTELATRRKLEVLERPFETTATLLAAFPAAATYFISSRLDDTTVLFSVAGSFAALAFVRRRVAFVVGLMIALNATWWSFIADSQHLNFERHPQVAMIPIGLSLFAYAQIYGHRIGEKAAAQFRWAGLLVIYLSSTFDLFVNAARFGIAHSPWLPIGTATLAIIGTLVGIGTRLRSFVYCGASFLLLSMVTIVWYASEALQWTWLWYVFGIATGAALIAAWAWIEHHRDRLLDLLTELRTWQT